MGNNRLGTLPRTYRWKQVIQIIDESGTLEDVANASIHAVEKTLERVPSDHGFTQTLTNIFEFIEAAQSKDFAKGLKEKGYDVGGEAKLFDLVCSLKRKIDKDLSATKSKSDLSELAQNSFTENLVKYVSAKTTSLFEVSSAEAQREIKQQLSGVNLKGVMHEFFSTFTARYLSYYLSRELPNHVGPGRRLSNIDQHQEFEKAFDLFVRQTVRITDEFTPGWFGKAKYERRISHEAVSRYAHVAFKKIISEFSRGADPGG